LLWVPARLTAEDRGPNREAAIRDHHTKRKKSYAKFENSKVQSPTELAGVSANEVEVKGYQITSCRKKGALMKFYDVVWAQGVNGKA